LSFLLKSLEAILRESELPPAIVDAFSIWTHVAGHRPDQAPTKAQRILSSGGRVTGVETDQGELLPADVVISDCGIATYLRLVAQDASRSRKRCERLPLQSPGVCAYLAIKGKLRPPYLKFLLPGGDERCRLLICPTSLNQPVVSDE